MRVYTKATPKLKELWDNYKGLKSGDVSEAKWFDNVDSKGLETGNFYANNMSNTYNNDYKLLTEQEFIEFMELEPLPKEETFNPQPHYDNSKGSLYKVATERGWNSYTFDIVKRLERGGKKDPLKQEIEKSIDVLKIWLSEL